MFTMGNCMTNSDDALNQCDEHNHHTIDNNTSILQSETSKITMANVNILKNVNLKIFQSNQCTNCDNNNDNPCQALKRMIIGLQYYETLSTDNISIKMTQEKKK
eukprot:395294_1